MNLELPPQGALLGPHGVSYRVWAPLSGKIELEIFDEAGQRRRLIPLLKDPRGFFHGLDADGQLGDLYKFRLDETQSFPDPSSRWQPQGVHGPSMVIDPAVYQWGDGGWNRPRFRDLVIYEMHVGTFTKEGTFRAAIEKLKSVREVGINAIELMPIGDFAGSRNWGYDGAYLYAPARCYGHPDDLRAFVDAAHEQGIAVILDVVYNHFGPDGNYLAAYIGDYLDEKAKTPWGGAIRYGHPNFKPLRDLVTANPVYWMREFHIDGFRLDATHAIFDDSSRHILQELTAAIHARGGFAIAEDPRNDSRLVIPEQEGGYGFDAVWADDFHHTVRVANTREDEGYLADFSGSLSEAINVFQHGWLYRGQHSPSQGCARGTECKHLPPQQFVHCISNHDQTGNHAFGERLSHHIHPAALRASEALLCLSPYTPMLFMGQEWIASTPFLFFTDHNPELGKLIVAGRRDEFKSFAAFRDPALLETIPDPQKSGTYEASKLVWEERGLPRHAGALELYKACLALRTGDEAFRPAQRDSWQACELKIGIGALRLRSAGSDWIVLFDLLGGHEGSLRNEPIFQNQQAWRVVLSTNEARFGGAGTCGVNIATMQVSFTIPECIVLQAMHQQSCNNIHKEAN